MSTQNQNQITAPLTIRVTIDKTPILPLHIKISSDAIAVYGDDLYYFDHDFPTIVIHETKVSPEVAKYGDIIKIYQRCKDTYPMATPWGFRPTCNEEVEFTMRIDKLMPRIDYGSYIDNPVTVWGNVLTILNPPQEFVMTLERRYDDAAIKLKAYNGDVVFAVFDRKFNAIRVTDMISDRIDRASLLFKNEQSYKQLKEDISLNNYYIIAFY